MEQRHLQNLRVADDELATGDLSEPDDGLPSPGRRVLMRTLRFRPSASVQAVRLESSDSSVISVIARLAVSISSETAESGKRCAALANRPSRSERSLSLAGVNGRSADGGSALGVGGPVRVAALGNERWSSETGGCGDTL